MSLAVPRRRLPRPIHSAPRLTGSTSPSETTRLQIVRLSYILCGLLIAEGALRKWAVPQLEQTLYFVRDPLVVVIYALALANGWLIGQRWHYAWMILALFAGVLGIVVHAAQGTSILVWVLGMRSYFLYIPLAFVIGTTWRRADLERFLYLSLHLLPVLGLLSLAQMNAPASAFINRGTGGALAVELAMGLARTNSVFAHGSQFASFVPAMAAVVLAAVLVRRGTSVRDFGLIIIGLAAVLVMLIATGSRSAWMRVAIVGVAAVIIAVCTRGSSSGGRARALIVPVLAVVGTVALFSAAFEQRYDAYQIRNARAGTFTSQTTDRIIGTFVPETAATASLAGEGIGRGLTGAAALVQGERNFSIGESDWDRNFGELGVIVGSAFVACRILFVIWLGALVWRSLRIGNPLPIVFYAYAGPTILVNQITMHTVFGHLAWLFAGLVIASSTIEQSSSHITARLQKYSSGRLADERGNLIRPLPHRRFMSVASRRNY